MSGLVLLASWCLVGGAVGALIGRYSGRLGVGIVLGSLCGVFGWVLLAGAAPRPRAVATAVDEPDPQGPSTLSWMRQFDDQPLVTAGGQL